MHPNLQEREGTENPKLIETNHVESVCGDVNNGNKPTSATTPPEKPPMNNSTTMTTTTATKLYYSSGGLDESTTLPPTEHLDPWPTYLRRRLPMLLRLSILYLAVLNYGFDLSVTNTTLGMSSFRKYFGRPSASSSSSSTATTTTYIIPSTYQSAWAGGTYGGQIATDMLGGWLADRFGRKPTLILSVLVMILAASLQVTAKGITQMILGKTVFGMGTGLFISFATSYAAELASWRIRGVVCMAVNFCIQLGNWVGAGAALGFERRFPGDGDERSFRYVLALQYVFAVLFLLLAWWLPESPVFLVHKGREEEAKKVVRMLYGGDYDCERHVAFLVAEHEAEKRVRRGEEVVEGLGEGGEGAAGGGGGKIKYTEILKGRNKIRAMIAACIVWPLFMGTAFWPSYQTYYFELAGASNAQAMNYGCTSVAIGTSIVAYFLIERVGRRRLWLVGCFGMAAANLIGGFMWIPFSSGSSRHRQIASKVATAMVFIWNGAYDIGPANMGYAIISEVPSGRMRVKTNAAVHVFSHLVGLGFSYAVPYLYNTDAAGLGLRIGFIWGAFGVVFLVWGWFYIPNLAGFNSFEIDQLFESKAPVRKFHHAEFDSNDLLLPGSMSGSSF